MIVTDTVCKQACQESACMLLSPQHQPAQMSGEMSGEATHGKSFAKRKQRRYNSAGRASEVLDALKLRSGPGERITSGRKVRQIDCVAVGNVRSLPLPALIPGDHSLTGPETFSLSPAHLETSFKPEICASCGQREPSRIDLRTAFELYSNFTMLWGNCADNLWIRSVYSPLYIGRRCPLALLSRQSASFWPTHPSHSFSHAPLRWCLGTGRALDPFLRLGPTTPGPRLRP